MIGDACVFALTQVANEFDCELGDLVTRRAGPDIACRSQKHQQQCLCVYEQLKQAGLAEFEYEDVVREETGNLLSLKSYMIVKACGITKIAPTLVAFILLVC